MLISDEINNITTAAESEKRKKEREKKIRVKLQFGPLFWSDGAKSCHLRRRAGGVGWVAARERDRGRSLAALK